MDKLPCKECGGKCCGPVPIPKLQIHNLRRRGRVPKGVREVEINEFAAVLLKDGDGLESQCIFYDKIRRECGIYEERPKICRIYGEHPALPCAHVHPGLAQKITDDYLKKMKPRSV